jgi:hypothetical protein
MQLNYQSMIAAANDWGPEHDENRRWFLAGWRDEEAGELHANAPEGTHETNMGPWCGYNSGVCAYREARKELEDTFH